MFYLKKCDKKSLDYFNKLEISLQQLNCRINNFNLIN